MRSTILVAVFSLVSIAAFLSPVNPVINPLADSLFVFPILHLLVSLVLLAKRRFFLLLSQLALLTLHLSGVLSELNGLQNGYTQAPHFGSNPLAIEIPSQALTSRELLISSGEYKILSSSQIELNSQKSFAEEISLISRTGATLRVIYFSHNALFSGYDNDAARIHLRRLAVNIRQGATPVVVFACDIQTPSYYWNWRYFIRAGRLIILPRPSYIEALFGSVANSCIVFGRGVRIGEGDVAI